MNKDLLLQLKRKQEAFAKSQLFLDEIIFFAESHTFVDEEAKIKFYKIWEEHQDAYPLLKNEVDAIVASFK